MARSQIPPIHRVLEEQWMTLTEKLYNSFNQEADAHEADELRTLDVITKIKAGEIKPEQIELTDGAWDIMPTEMVSKPSANGRKSKKEAADAVPATSS